MRRLAILHTESSQEWGGEELRVLREAQGLLRRGHRVLLAVPPHSRLETLALREGLRVEGLPMNGLPSFQAIRRFRAVVFGTGIDVVNTHGSRDSWLAFAALATLRQRPWVIRTRHKSTPVRRGILNALLYRRFTDLIITTGEAVRETLISENGLDPDRVVSIPTGVDLTLFTPSPRYDGLKQELGLSPGSPLIGTVSFLRDYKGHAVLLEAACHVLRVCPEARFLIAGEGPLKDSLQQRMTDLGLTGRVLFLGHREDVPRVMQALDVFVLSSLRGEGLPQGVLQAMAMERPVVATRVGAVPEAVHEGVTGHLVSAGDPEGLAEKITLLLKDHGAQRTMGKAGRAVVEKHYSLETMLDKVEAAYEQLMGRRDGR